MNVNNEDIIEISSSSSSSSSPVSSDNEERDEDENTSTFTTSSDDESDDESLREFQDIKSVSNEEAKKVIERIVLNEQRELTPRIAQFLVTHAKIFLNTIVCHLSKTSFFLFFFSLFLDTSIIRNYVCSSNIHSVIEHTLT